MIAAASIELILNPLTAKAVAGTIRSFGTVSFMTIGRVR